MNYQQAVDALDNFHSGAHATSETMLDAINYRGLLAVYEAADKYLAAEIDEDAFTEIVLKFQESLV